jgi:hypothetical protein
MREYLGANRPLEFPLEENFVDARCGMWSVFDKAAPIHYFR